MTAARVVDIACASLAVTCASSLAADASSKRRAASIRSTHSPPGPFHTAAPSRRRARLVEVAHTLKRAAVAVGEQVEVTPRWRRLSPFLQGYQHISLDQRFGELYHRDV